MLSAVCNTFFRIPLLSKKILHKTFCSPILFSQNIFSLFTFLTKEIFSTSKNAHFLSTKFTQLHQFFSSEWLCFTHTFLTNFYCTHFFTHNKICVHNLDSHTLWPRWKMRRITQLCLTCCHIHYDHVYMTMPVFGNWFFIYLFFK